MSVLGEQLVNHFAHTHRFCVQTRLDTFIKTPEKAGLGATWRSGYAADCKSDSPTGNPHKSNTQHPKFGADFASIRDVLHTDLQMIAVVSPTHE